MSELALEIKDINTSFKNFRLKNISMSVEKGTIMGIIGENGSGKTTTIKTIMNMYYSDKGKIMVYGYDHIEDEVKVKNIIGYVAAEEYFANNFSMKFLEDNFSKLYDEWDKELFNRLVTKWKLRKTEPFSTYSKGMKTKAMLILALAHRPKLLLLDEPTAGLDPIAKNEVLDILRDFVSDGEHSVIFSTHITTDLDKVADAVTLISDGRVILSDTMDVLEDRYIKISGDENILKDYTQFLIGENVNCGQTMALTFRENIDKFPKDSVSISIPDIEDIMVYNVRACEKTHAKAEL